MDGQQTIIDGRKFTRTELYRLYRSVFDNAHGQRVIAHLARRFNYSSPCYVKNDIYSTLVNEGQRQVVLYLMRMMSTPVEEKPTD